MKAKEVATPKQIKEWKEKYGNVYLLESDDKQCVIFDPMSNLKVMKQLFIARRKTKGDMVDAAITNCWLAGDASLKDDDRFKLGVEDQVDSLLDIPDFEIESIEGVEDSVTVKIEDKSIIVKKAGRGDVAWAEARNTENKPLVTQEFLLERIATDKPALDELKKSNRIYMGLLLATSSLKDRAFVSIKKL